MNNIWSLLVGQRRFYCFLSRKNCRGAPFQPHGIDICLTSCCIPRLFELSEFPASCGKIRFVNCHQQTILWPTRSIPGTNCVGNVESTNKTIHFCPIFSEWNTVIAYLKLRLQSFRPAIPFARPSSVACLGAAMAAAAPGAAAAALAATGVGEAAHVDGLRRRMKSYPYACAFVMQPVGTHVGTQPHCLTKNQYRYVARTFAVTIRKCIY